MSIDRVQLNGKKILEKDFKTGIRGYSQEEVDEFLDIIIQDYDNFKQEIDRLNEEIEKLKSNRPAAETPRARSTQQSSQVNYDVLKRLSNLEKAVFGKRYADSEE
ncbi:cell cycle protein GpsB [Oceanobacillus oncorhynchi subsp. incaldanensis]|uniref:Cell cycle protein GpsB n=2 Tax=Oceanobacillus TaxID=182709 RepID=A0A0A1MVW2_9BACI|nr:cell division regulator GpsB [Oceanobacillus oncorhynchi]MDM8101568.1 cell division regulator GpsB [Oceanobacillus oncorhynchi]UUI38064.1 cell division regulator GpsB [Oceanobacillus oncorhynchi]GIO17236.1 cell cycle protein GpsB [Oceanobacillus oncorhynchi subsp. incaldanensis]CEI83714.1 Cell cycle protein GpsB [Oceanobacillus oncorhynchi]